MCVGGGGVSVLLQTVSQNIELTNLILGGSLSSDSDRKSFDLENNRPG